MRRGMFPPSTAGAALQQPAFQHTAAAKLIAAFVLSACFLAICSKSSFLYPMNDWVDVNCFYTVGRGWIHGMIPYVDLYDQKGPILYFVFGLLSLISEQSYLPLYILEVVCFTLFLYYSGKCAALYLGDGTAVYLVMLVLAAVVPVSAAFAHGGSVEELSLCMLACSLYFVLGAVRSNKPLSFRHTFIIGIFAAVSLWTKFTICGFYLGLAVFVVIWYLTDKSRANRLWLVIVQFLFGVAAVSAFVLAYFLYHNALGTLLQSYFFYNTFQYARLNRGSVFQLILSSCHSFIHMLRNNLWYSLLMTLGAIWMLIDLKHHWRESLAVYLSLGALALGVYIGGVQHPYYGLIFSVYAVFGLVALGQLVRRLYARAKHLPRLWLQRTGLGVLFVLLLITVYRSSSNVYLMSYEKDDMPQYRFAKRIDSVDHSTLLQYGALDGGFYFASNKLPQNRFFCALNARIPELGEEQNRSITNAETDFVVTRGIRLGIDVPCSSAYTCIDQASFFFETPQVYYLYQKNAPSS